MEIKHTRVKEHVSYFFLVEIIDFQISFRSFNMLDMITLGIRIKQKLTIITILGPRFSPGQNIPRNFTLFYTYVWQCFALGVEMCKQRIFKRT